MQRRMVFNDILRRMLGLYVALLFGRIQYRLSVMCSMIRL